MRLVAILSNPVTAYDSSFQVSYRCLFYARSCPGLQPHICNCLLAIIHRRKSPALQVPSAGPSEFFQFPYFCINCTSLQVSHVSILRFHFDFPPPLCLLRAFCYLGINLRSERFLHPLFFFLTLLLKISPGPS